MGQSAGLFAELKRRNVLRAAALYVGAIWALAQGIAQLAPVFGIPDWVVRWFVAAGAIGFPFWLAFAWFYEFTPEGLKRESELDPADLTARARGRRLDKWIIGVLVVAVVLLVTNQFVLRRDATSRDAATVAPATPPQATQRSIAVLPFDNLSRDADNAYFARGMQDLILTRLSEIGELKVISRTSTLKYGSRPENLRQVAAELGVMTVLEGSVQKSGNDVLINVQLIDARTDAHLWGESYQRTLDNIFGMEGEVAQSVADALRARLTPDEAQRMAEVPTHDREAYDYYLRAEFQLDRGVMAFDTAAVRAAIEAYGKAIARDPRFGLAFARRSYAENFLAWIGGGGLAIESLFMQGHDDAKRAMELAPRLAASHVAAGYSEYFGQDNPRTAIAALKAGLDIQPHDSQALEGLALIERRTVSIDSALGRLRQALPYDPRNLNLIGILAETLTMASNYDEAGVWYERSLLIDPGNDGATANKALLAVLANGDTATALGMLQGDAMLLRITRVQVLTLQRKDAQALAELQAIPVGSFMLNNDKDLMMAGLQRRLGRHAQARRSYQLALQEAQGKIHSRTAVLRAWAWSHVAAAQIGLGQLQEGEQAIAHSQAELDPARDHVDGPILLVANAKNYLAAGRKELALQALQQAMALPGIGLTTSPKLLALDPDWDGVRQDERFLRLVARHGGE